MSSVRRRRRLISGYLRRSTSGRVSMSGLICGIVGVLFFLGVGVSPAPVSAQGERKAKSSKDRQASLVFNTASRLYRQDNWRDAAAAFGQFLERFPRHQDATEARFARGYCHNRLGDHAAAVADLKLAGRDPKARWAGDANFFLGRSYEAIAQKSAQGSTARSKGYRAAAASYGVAASIRLAAARALGRSGAPKEREEKLDAYVQALVSQGEAFYHGGVPQSAAGTLASLSKSANLLARSDSYPRGVYFLALSSYAIEGAEDGSTFTKTLESLTWLSSRNREGQSFWAESAYLQSRIFHRQRSWSAAIALYTRLIDRDADSDSEMRADAAYYRGLAYYEMGAKNPQGGASSLAKAAMELAAFHRDHPEHEQVVRARYYEALALFHRGDYGTAADRLASFASDENITAKAAPLLPQVWLSLGQALLLQKEPNATSAAAVLGRCTSLIRGRVDNDSEDASLAKKLAQSQYWRGEALFSWALETENVDDRDERFVESAGSFIEVSGPLGRPVPELAEEALYKAADAYLRAGEHAECAKAAASYRETHGAKGRFIVDSLALAGRNALRAPEGSILEIERRAAPTYYAQAAKMTNVATDKRRYEYLSGVAHYYNDDFPNAITSLGGVYGAFVDDPAAREGKEYDELAFFLADSFAQKFRASGEKSVDDADQSAKQELLDAAALFGEYLEVVRKTPGKPSARHVPTARVNQGLCYQWAGDLTSARAAYAAFLKDHPGHELALRIRFSLAGVSLDDGDEKAALTAYRAVATTKDPSAANHVDLIVRAGLQAAALERRFERPQAAIDLLGDALTRVSKIESQETRRSLQIDARFQRAMALVELEQPAEARKALTSFLESFPGSANDPEARLQLAYLCLDDGDAAAALAAVAPICDSEEDVSGRDEAIYLRAWAYGSQAEALAGESDDDDANDDANAEAIAKLNAQMEAAYRLLISQYPNSDFAQDGSLELGQHLFNRGEYTEAKQWFGSLRKKLEEENGDVDPDRHGELLERSVYGLAFVSFEEKDYRSARSLFDTVSKRTESDLAPRATFQAARSWMLSKGEEEAATRFQKLVGDLKPRAGEFYEESLLRLAECRHKLQEYAISVTLFERLLKESPEGDLRHDARFGLGLSLQYLDKSKEAVEQFRQVVADNPGVVGARAQYHIGECFMDQKKYREAAREFLVVVANFDFDGGYRPWFRRSLLSAGLSYQADGDLKAAKLQWKELIERFPESPEAKAAASRMKN